MELKSKLKLLKELLQPSERIEFILDEKDAIAEFGVIYVLFDIKGE